MRTDEEFTIQSVVTPSHRMVLRIRFNPDPPDLDRREEVLAHARQNNLLLEWYSEHYLAIDSPSEERLTTLVALAEGLLEEGTGFYEYGHGPPPPEEFSFPDSPDS